MRIATGYAQAGDARIYYECAGAGDPPLVLIHAGNSDCRLWDGQFEDFARDHFVLRYDLRGFGRSTLPPGPFFMPDDLKALLDQVGVERPVLVGASVGGRAALEFALAYPGVARALVLAAPVLRAVPTSPEVVEARRVEDGALEAGDVETAIQSVVDAWLVGPRRRRDEVDEKLVERIWTMQRHSFHLQVLDYAHPEPWGPEDELDPPAKDRLREVDVPAYALFGDKDMPDSLESFGLLAGQLPDVRAELVPGVAHMVALELGDEFTARVASFLAERVPAHPERELEPVPAR